MDNLPIHMKFMRKIPGATEFPRLGFHLRTTPLTRGSGYWDPRVPPRDGAILEDLAGEEWANLNHEPWRFRPWWRYVLINGSWLVFQLQLKEFKPQASVFSSSHWCGHRLPSYLRIGLEGGPGNIIEVSSRVRWHEDKSRNLLVLSREWMGIGEWEYH